MLFAIYALISIGFGALLAWQLIKANQRARKALHATNAEYDASGAFREWYLKNQDLYVGLSEEGRTLVLN